jgi:hypothetical protein
MVKGFAEAESIRKSSFAERLESQQVSVVQESAVARRGASAPLQKELAHEDDCFKMVGNSLWFSEPCLMPYCSTCNYWTRGKKSRLAGVPCKNCGTLSGKAIGEGDPPSMQQLQAASTVLGVGGVLGLLMAVYGFAAGQPGSWALLLAGLLFLGFWKRERDLAKRQWEAQQQSHQATFHEIRYQINSLKTSAEHLREVLRAELAETRSERGERRLELLQAALKSREKRMQQLGGELWARDVQLWLNQVEGFLAERFPKLQRRNGGELLGGIRTLMTQGRDLRTRGGNLSEPGETALRARTVLDQCLARAPDLEERVRDARVLAAVGGEPDVPFELAEGTSWLHWLEEAIPTIDLLPVEFTEDDEFLRVQAELRLLRDSVKQNASGSLDRPFTEVESASVAAQRH